MNHLLTLVRLLPPFACLPLFAGVAEATVPAVSPMGTVHEYIEDADVRIVKVYSIHDGDHRAQSYVIEWKGQEVVVMDATHSLRRIRPGQPVRVRVDKMPSRPGRSHGVVMFLVEAPKPAADATPPLRLKREERLKIPGNDYGTFTTPVLRVYSASDGPHLFRAYVFDWKGEEAIAFDHLVSTDHEVGEMMTVFYSRHLTPGRAEQAHGSLNFQVISEPRPRRGLFRR